MILVLSMDRRGMLKLDDNVPFGMMVGEMAKRIPMSKWDVNRAEIPNAVVEEKVTLKYAAKRLQVSYRQAKRLLKRYREEGAAGIVHRNVGKLSQRRIDESTRQSVLALHRVKYSDFGRDGNVESDLASWCSSMEVTTTGLSTAVSAVV